MTEILDFSSTEDSSSSTSELSDEAKGLSHGYEGDFKIGDVVRVSIHTKIYSVKKYGKDGFDPFGYVGTVHSMDLYGRKLKQLCSAITPIKVEFAVDGDGIPANMFDKKWIAHFSAEELELISKTE